MHKPTPTRTYAQLHLEDIEPHRFEDLVRQLIYDFRSWDKLEATGRAGADDGYDARAWERVPSDEIEAVDPDEFDEGVSAARTGEGRLWLIQCKREQTIGPKKLADYLDEIPEGDRPYIHGVIFAASCDFSKKSRDSFREKLLNFGISEGHLWGKGEIEDQLFQPNNDHLLFAYFGISFQIRKRSIRTQIRSRLAMKRKLKQKLEKGFKVTVIDANDERFPYLDEDKTKDRFERGRWRNYWFNSFDIYGIIMCVYGFHAFVSDDRMSWDYYEHRNLVRFDDDRWDGHEERRNFGNVIKQWMDLPADQRAQLEVYRLIDYNNIIDIDVIDEEYGEENHLYVDSWDPQHGPFEHDWLIDSLAPEGRFALDWIKDVSADNRVAFFPREEPGHEPE